MNFPPMSNDKPIILIGLMGAGKTTIGTLLAARLSRSFIDTDQVLEARTGVSIATIFEIEGEASFRDREAAAIREVVRTPNAVISTGGGCVLRSETRTLMRQQGVVIYLHAAPAVSYARLKKAKDRPLLRGTDAFERLSTLYSERHQLYEATGHLIIDAHRDKPSQVVDEIVQRLAAFASEE
jgi:shikimate kinase